VYFAYQRVIIKNLKKMQDEFETKVLEEEEKLEEETTSSEEESE
jgi:hypothetical protein